MSSRIINSRLTAFVGLVLAFATLAAFWPVLRNGFVNYDDPLYVKLNPHLAGGLTWANVQWAFTSGYASNWHPLTWLSHMLDVQLFGLEPGGHHLTSLLIHLANTLLLLVALKRMTGALWRSALVAALFALHPLHVESVAWVAERKDVLSGFLFLLTLWAYSRYAECGVRSAECGMPGPQPGGTHHSALRTPHSALGNPVLFYLLSLACFALGLLSKPMLVTLPFVLLLLDYWPLSRRPKAAGRRQNGEPPCPALASRFHPSSFILHPLLLEKLPFFLLSAVSCVVTWQAQAGGEAIASFDKLPLGTRIGHAFAAYAGYLQQTFWPSGLTVFYPMPPELSAVKTIGSAIVLAVLTAGALILARRWRWAPVGWFWYLGMLVPVIGLVQVGEQARADRYTYLPLIGIFILVAWGAGALTPLAAAPAGQNPQSSIRNPQSSIVGALLGVVAVVMLAVLALTTYRQAGVWRNSRSLFAHGVRVEPNSYVAWQGLGIAELERQDTAAALTNFTRALACNRAHGAAGQGLYFTGVALQLQDRGLEALPYLEQSVVPVEQRPDREYRLGLSLIAAKRLAEAETALLRALSAKPANAEYQLGMAALRSAQGRTEEAEGLLREVVNAHPDLAQARGVFGEFLMARHRPAEAEAQYAAALKLRPPDARLLRAYAGTLARQGKTGDAVRELEAALKLEPGDAGANFELAELLSLQGRNREAVAHYSRALEANPKLLTALNNLAWLLATCPEAGIRNGPRAVELAERACQLVEWQEAFLAGTLAAAYAEAARFPDAVRTAEKAIGLAEAAGQKELAERNRQLLELYRAGKPFHETPP